MGETDAGRTRKHAVQMRPCVGGTELAYLVHECLSPPNELTDPCKISPDPADLAQLGPQIELRDQPFGR